jgi:hypothetical protein
MIETMKRTEFNAARGGHAPGHLRDAFSECFESPHSELWYSALANDDVLSFYSHELQEIWNHMSVEERGRWLVGQLWNCSDVMPGSLCDDLDLRQGSTYAVAARKLRRKM